MLDLLCPFVYSFRHTDASPLRTQPLKCRGKQVEISLYLYRVLPTGEVSVTQVILHLIVKSAMQNNEGHCQFLCLLNVKCQLELLLVILYNVLLLSLYASFLRS